MPFGYVSPEQVMKDKADYARKGIARGRSVLVLTYDDGILFVAENPSGTLHKVSELYDRVAFAAVGRYNEYESLRVAGVRLADMRGYAYDRSDVTGRALANAYAQQLGAIFADSKPFEVEIVVAEVGAAEASDQIYRVTYDGSVADERGVVAAGGQSEPITNYLREHHQAGQSLGEALGVAVRALAGPANGGEVRELSAAQLEVAVLSRSRPRRAFKRLLDSQVERLLPDVSPAGAPAEGTVGGDRGDGPHATT